MSKASSNTPACFFLPQKAPYDLWNRDGARGLKLYVQRVFIMDEAEQFLPLYLRFVKGILDSNDFPLNVSREILQNDPKVDKVRGALTKRVLDLMSRLKKKDAEAYAGFWKEFGQALEGRAGRGLRQPRENRFTVSFQQHRIRR